MSDSSMDQAVHVARTGAAARLVLAQLPQVQRVMEHSLARSLCASFGREEVIRGLRDALQTARSEILAGATSIPDFFSEQFFETLRLELTRRRECCLTHVINATGVVLHTNLGRAPLASEAVDAICALASGYCNLEYDLAGGARGSRYSHVEDTLCRITGAEAAVVVNNCAAAVLLVLTAIAAGGEVLVSRGELIEIGGSFRMPDVIAQSGARLVEVGATNKTRLSDYERAITANTRMILCSHPSNYRIVGFAAQPERQELSTLAHDHGLVFAEDLGSGTLVDLRRYGLPYEPTVQECVRGGADIVAFSGDKLLGGPQAGVLLGRRDVMETLKAHPLLRALRIDKLSLCALESTLRLYSEAAPPEHHIPVLRMLAERKPALVRRARRLVRALRLLDGVSCWTEAAMSLAGGGALPQAELPTCIVKLRAHAFGPDELARRLRLQRPALIGRIADGCFMMDVRTIMPREASLIPKAIAAAIR